MIQGLFDQPELQEFGTPHTTTITTRSFATSTGTQDVDVAQFFFGIAVRCLLRIDIRRCLNSFGTWQVQETIFCSRQSTEPDWMCPIMSNPSPNKRTLIDSTGTCKFM